MVIPESQIRALIRLLGDEDEKIVKTISGKLVDIGTTAVPLLQEAEIEQPEMAERIASVLEEIRGGKLEDELVQLSALPDGQMDLERGAFLIARYAYPSLDVPSYRRQLDDMAQEVRDRITQTNRRAAHVRPAAVIIGQLQRRCDVLDPAQTRIHQRKGIFGLFGLVEKALGGNKAFKDDIHCPARLF